MFLNPYPAKGSICRLPYADNVAPDQPAHLQSLTSELHCPLCCEIIFFTSQLTVALSEDYVNAQADPELHCPHLSERPY